LSETALVNDFTAFDDSYLDQKNLSNNYLTKSSLPLTITNNAIYPQSHHAVLNSFRSDYEDFSHFSDIGFKNPTLSSKNSSNNLNNSVTLNPLVKKFNQAAIPTHTNSMKSELTTGFENTPNQLNWSRFSNPLVLRRSAKSSIVTNQSYQKVFKLRYEEGRAHVRLSDFANSAKPQPYTTEQRIKYEKILGKTKLRFFNTTVNLPKLLPVFNPNVGLMNSLNTYFFEFPFLEGVTSDPTRHVWFETFIRYAQREVSGSSVSKYTIVGVPFHKKLYDFNAKQGKQLADTELYFSRIRTSRKNYLPQ
jgi:hypothetical protein